MKKLRNCSVPSQLRVKIHENRLRRWDFDLHVSGFWHIHAKTPRGITVC